MELSSWKSQKSSYNIKILRKNPKKKKSIVCIIPLKNPMKIFSRKDDKRYQKVREVVFL